jgi:uncharacterized membrane protein YphA (DoxX/SURF4 family)
VRRSPGGIALIVGAVLLAVAIGLWWMERVAFTPTDDADAARSVMADPEIRGQIATIIASADAPILQQSPTELKEFIEQILQIPDGAALLSRVAASGHSRVVGETDELVVITAEEQVGMVRDELVGEAPSLTLPVSTSTSLSAVNDWIGWVAVGTGSIGLLAILAGILMRPERGEGVFALAVGFGSLAASLFLFGFLVPLTMMAPLSDDPWMGVFPALAEHHRNRTLLLMIVALVIAGLVAFSAYNRRSRRQRSTPLNVARYRDERSWSR